jgi:SOS-response transcriptional repressor LexA
MEAYSIINHILEQKQISKRDFVKRISAVCNEDVPEQTIYSYLSGRRGIPFEFRTTMTKALDVPLNVVFNDKDTIEFVREYTNGRAIDVISLPVFEAAAGCGAEGYLEQLEFLSDKIDMDKKLFPENMNFKSLAIIHIVGDSMSPYLDENDKAIVQLRKGDIVFADGVYLVAHGQNVQIKSCQFQSDGSCKLLSINPIYPPITAEAGNWDIIGKIVARLKVGSLFQLK